MAHVPKLWLCFINKVLLRQSYPFIKSLSMTAFVLQQQNQMVGQETLITRNMNYL